MVEGGTVRLVGTHGVSIEVKDETALGVAQAEDVEHRSDDDLALLLLAGA